MVSNVFYVHPYLGKIPMLTNIFQMGWNHQLDCSCYCFYRLWLFSMTTFEFGLVGTQQVSNWELTPNPIGVFLMTPWGKAVKGSDIAHRKTLKGGWVMWIFCQIAEHIWFQNDMNDYSLHIVIVPYCANLYSFLVHVWKSSQPQAFGGSPIAPRWAVETGLHEGHAINPRFMR